MSRLNEFTEHEVEVEQLLYCSAGASFYTMAPKEEGAEKGLSPDPSRNQGMITMHSNFLSQLQEQREVIMFSLQISTSNGGRDM